MLPSSLDHGAHELLRRVDVDALRVCALALQADLAATQDHVETVAECQGSVHRDQAEIWGLLARSWETEARGIQAAQDARQRAALASEHLLALSKVLGYSAAPPGPMDSVWTMFGETGEGVGSGYDPTPATPASDDDGADTTADEPSAGAASLDAQGKGEELPSGVPEASAPAPQEAGRPLESTLDPKYDQVLRELVDQQVWSKYCCKWATGSSMDAEQCDDWWREQSAIEEAALEPHLRKTWSEQPAVVAASTSETQPKWSGPKHEFWRTSKWKGPIQPAWPPDAKVLSSGAKARPSVAHRARSQSPSPAKFWGKSGARPSSSWVPANESEATKSAASSSGAHSATGKAAGLLGAPLVPEACPPWRKRKQSSEDGASGHA
jgi:hypothetical protein